MYNAYFISFGFGSVGLPGLTGLGVPQRKVQNLDSDIFLMGK